MQVKNGPPGVEERARNLAKKKIAGALDDTEVVYEFLDTSDTEFIFISVESSITLENLKELLQKVLPKKTFVAQIF